MPKSDVKTRILHCLGAKPDLGVWTPVDFLDLGRRDVVCKVLQQLAHANKIQRIDRGLYFRPRLNRLTGHPTNPDYRKIVAALARRDQTRMLIDGLTAANDLGLTDAVPARVVIHTDGRLKSLRLGKLDVHFKQTAPSKLYWAGRPAMKVVQALHWLRDTLPQDKNRIVRRLHAILHEPKHGKRLRNDLQDGLPTLPAWMQNLVHEVLQAPNEKRQTWARDNTRPNGRQYSSRK